MKINYMVLRSVCAALCIISIVACTKKEQISQESAVKNSESVQHIQVQHILVGFKGTLPGKELKRTQDEAKKLADEILSKANSGGDFDALVKEYTDDRAPGIYGMSNTGVTPQGDEFPREQMVAAFGDVGFALQVGEVALAQYDPQKSPFGYHIIKRLK